MRVLWRVLAAAYCVALVFSLAGNLKALPEYSVAYGQSCQLCHYSVTGSGARNPYGSQYFSYMELPAKPLTFASLDSLQSSLGNKISFGFDFRDLFYYAHPEKNPSLDSQSFVTMQGSLYLTFTPSDHVSVVFDKGLYTGFEAYAQLNAGLGGPFFKVGRFMPDFGWRFADHRAFTRRFTGFGGEQGVSQREDGIEGGLVGEHWEMTGALTNGPSTTPIDINNSKTVTLRGASRFQLSGLSSTLGASWRYQELGQTSGQLTRLGGLFYGVQAGRLGVLGEADWIAQGKGSFTVSNLLSWRVKRGWYVKERIGYYDPDRNVANDSWWRSSTSLAWIPTGYLAVEPGVEYVSNPLDNTLTAEVMIHLWY